MALQQDRQFHAEINGMIMCGQMSHCHVGTGELR